MRTALISSIIIIFVLGYLLFSEEQNKGSERVLYQDSIRTLLNDKNVLKGKEIALNEQIELSILTGRDKDRQIRELKAEYQDILTRPPKTVVIRDTVKYIQNCEQVKELHSNALKQIEALEGKVLICEEIINDQQELIKNLRSQVRKTEEIVSHTNALLEIQKKETQKQRKHKKIAVIGGGVALIAGLIL